MNNNYDKYTGIFTGIYPLTADSIILFDAGDFDGIFVCKFITQALRDFAVQYLGKETEVLAHNIPIPHNYWRTLEVYFINPIKELS